MTFADGPMEILGFCARRGRMKAFGSSRGVS
jgi:hypothetical protein